MHDGRRVERRAERAPRILPPQRRPPERARGVRVVFEVDHPGHLSSACRGYPALCPADCAWDAGANAVPLAPANNDTWRMLADTLAELAELTPGDEFLHLGGDEVDTTCWSQTPEIVAWLAARNLTAADGTRVGPPPPHTHTQHTRSGA